ncbi:unnamed protein product [Rotaria sp. Silwood2]|nr:unnamed protein product [Rotaria sp. Silwood2]CAF2868526.1 unnamed protein product [Rotaria sp. Silwood2]CAF4135778.1 unnamed protein product [Rotaria sp. Silwood2]CAF4250096.1 unnamed protein product [Rotaria sp. Silwood2]CAF4568824.1 unnamed protein product [Rotaria sp. Silwood2]
MSFFFPSSSTVEEKQKPSRNLSQENPSFIWFQLFVEVLLCIATTLTAKRDIIGECRRLNVHNIKTLRMIEEFESTCKSNDASQWYTKAVFVYHVLNKAFRTEDIDRIFRFRYFIVDLYHQQDNLHEQERHTIEEHIVVK